MPRRDVEEGAGVAGAGIVGPPMPVPIKVRVAYDSIPDAPGGSPSLSASASSHPAHYGTLVSLLQEEALEVRMGSSLPSRESLVSPGPKSDDGSPPSDKTPLVSAAFPVPAQPPRKRKFFASWFTPSFVIVALVVLNGDSARGALFPTLWPLVSSLGGDRIIQGYVVSAFSFGRLISSPFIGRLSEMYGYRMVLITTSLILCVGTLLYASATTIWHVLASQIVMGIGSGTLGVTRAYVAEQTVRQKRTVLLAYLTAVQYAGFTVMPVVGGILEDAFGRDSVHLIGPLRADRYTSPALFMGFMSLVAVVLLYTVFQDHGQTDLSAAKGKEAKADAPSLNGSATTVAPPASASPTHYSARANSVIFGGILLNVATKGSIAVYETLGIQFATTHFAGLTAADAGFIFAGFGFLGVVALLYMKRLCQWFTDVELIVGGMALMIACNLFLIGPDTFPIWRFYVAIFLMYAVGYPVGHTAVIGMFSKVLGKRPQGYLMGWFGSAGSLARVVFPIVGGHVAQSLGNNTLFAGEAVLLAVSGLLLAISRAEVLHMSENDH